MVDPALTKDAGRLTGGGLLGRNIMISVSTTLPDSSIGVMLRELEKMKPEAVLVNTSRGPVVDEAAPEPAPA